MPFWPLAPCAREHDLCASLLQNHNQIVHDVLRKDIIMAIVMAAIVFFRVAHRRWRLEVEMPCQPLDDITRMPGVHACSGPVARFATRLGGGFRAHIWGFDRLSTALAVAVGRTECTDLCSTLRANLDGPACGALSSVLTHYMRRLTRDAQGKI